MFPSLLVKLRPTTAWRIGPDSGARDKVDTIYHSDNLFSAVTLAMQRLGRLEEWLADTVGASPSAVRFSSCFPFVDESLYIVPPRSLWPPASSGRVRWKSARFVPVSLVEKLLNDPAARLREDDGWVVDADSQCLLHHGKGRPRGPFRPTIRQQTPVDRVTGVSGAPVPSACLEFAAGSGLWFAAVFSNDEASEKWAQPLTACLRLLADSGFGGERSRGWGRSEAPVIAKGRFPRQVVHLRAKQAEPAPAEEGAADAPPPEPAETAYWMLSLFSPAAGEAVDWERGSYALVNRGGRIESRERPGEGKRHLRMVTEGSVLFAHAPLHGAAPDVAPEGFPHPVYRAGFALAIPIEWRVVA